jgi:hypothetical protein
MDFTMLGENDQKNTARASGAITSGCYTAFTTLRRLNLSGSNESQRSPRATSSRQRRERSRAMRSIAPSSCAE